MQKVVYEIKVQFNYKHMQCPTMCYKTKPDSVTDVCMGGRGGRELLVCVNCAFSSLAKRDNTSTLSECWPPKALALSLKSLKGLG